MDQKTAHSAQVKSPGKHDDASLPNERDTSPDTAGKQGPRKQIRQAAEDLKQGQVDTDLHGERGIDQAVNPHNITKTPK